MIKMDRIDKTTGIGYRGRMVSDSGMVSYMAWDSGSPLGTVFKWHGKWSSAYSQDGEHRTLRALSIRMRERCTAL